MQTVILTENSPGVLCPSCPYSRLGSLKQSLGLSQRTATQQVALSCHTQPSGNSALQMSLPPDTPQGVADALGYLQHHLHELTERQNVSKNNINTTLVALTVQLQQLTQLVANPPPLCPYQTPLLCLYHPLRRLHPLLRQQDVLVPSSPALWTSVENITTAVHF